MRGLYVAAAVACGVLYAAPAVADCSSEVALAVQAQGKQKFLRKDTTMIGESGLVKMTVEYQTPDRMRQVVTPLTEGKPVEAVVVGDKAWTNNGEGWKQSPKDEAEQLVLFMIKSSAQIYQEVGKFECLGAETIDGRQLRAYRGVDASTKMMGKDGKPMEGTTGAKNEAVRVVYLDPATGLPARSVYARAGMLDKPIFREDYSYPEDIKIEPPADVKQ